MNKDLIVNCPTCKKSVAWKDSNNFKPFCSKRCRLIDLGEWASESHRIAGQELPEELVEELKKQQD
ncbi:MAG: DNA gyrase inhibitor YacG [Kangiellaceae bacterium]|nr:DNA gyrase inhibitor YacG [Kangiellaceae bacterium]